MTAHTGPADHQQQTAPPPGVWYPEDEIDLREYILVLVAWWREIVLIALLAAIVGAGAVLALRLLQDPVYEASALVAISRVRSDVNFEERFVTETGEELTDSTNTDARRLALVGLVDSSSVAETVIDELGDLLGEEERQPAVLLERVEGELASIGDSRNPSDLVRITVRADSPEKAAAIANAWAQAYVDRTNRLYGDVPNELLASVQTELANAQATYDEAQARLETFIASSDANRLERLIAEKQRTIASLQESRQTVLKTALDTYLQVLGQNRLLVFTKEQEARQELLSAYIDAEVENRVAAFENDRAVRRQLYEKLVQAELDSVTAVVDEQVAAALFELSRAYVERQRLEELLADAQSLRVQIAEGGDAAVTTNAWALALLKIQAFAAVDSLPPQSNSQGLALANQASRTQDDAELDDVQQDVPQQDGSPQVARAVPRTLPGDLQIDLGALGSTNSTAAEQQADVDALIQALAERIEGLTADIEVQSQALVNGDTYRFLDALDPSQLAASGAAGDEESLSPLQRSILQRYRDLYDVGDLAAASQIAQDDTELAAGIQALAAQVSETGTPALGTEDASRWLADQEEIDSLLRWYGLNPALDTESSEPIDQAISALEEEIRVLQAQQEEAAARRQRLTQERDLAQGTLNTLQNKIAELRLASTTANSEVRFAVPAVPPLEPVEGPSLLTTTALAGIVGLMLAVFVAFLANFLGAEPLFGTRTTNAALKQ